ncbi:hypothetical protein ABIB40_002709 [Pedobacter sp. UYP30]|uniref:hypothetical protein n=1 Tax=Pedobacter sp. UYP30 TaxID=1756400 RepID=UPI003396F5FC
MKKLLMILAIVAITTTGAFAYGGDVRSPDYGYNNNINTAIFYDGVSTYGNLYYTLYVQSYGEARIDVGEGRSWRNGNPNNYQTGYFQGPFPYVFMSAAVNAPGGYCYVSADW